MVPRGTLDLAWSDLAAALRAVFWMGRRDELEQAIAEAWQTQTALGAATCQHVLATLSVRSAWDLLLREMAWPAGSEVLLSGVTIPDMVTILCAHGLVPVPLAIDPETLTVDLVDCRAALTPRTRAILIAPLYGARVELSAIMTLACEHGLLVIEDGAQQFGTMTPWQDRQASVTPDVRLLSFGLIKTATALGGALLITADHALASGLRARQAGQPVQSRWNYLRRVGKGLLLKSLSNPRLYSLFVQVCRAVGQNHDRCLTIKLRSFAGPNLLTRLRQQPAGPLLQMLRRRLQNFRPAQLTWRTQLAKTVIEQGPALCWPGITASANTHWALPVVSRDPGGLITFLQARGFDATQRASSLIDVSTEGSLGSSAPWLASVVYLPLHPAMSHAAAVRLGQLVAEHEVLTTPAPQQPLLAVGAL